jgi:tRNA A37 methylthiotransferase MiaB
VLTEGYDGHKGLVFGKMTNFKMVYFPGEENMVGTFKTVSIEGSSKNSLTGRIIERKGR